MRALVRCLTVAGALALALASIASAQMPGEEMSTRLISIGIGGGVSVPVNDAKDAFKNGVSGQGFVRLNLKMLPIAPRVEFSFSKFDLDEVKVGTPGTQQILSGLATAQFFLMHGSVRPYIVAGIGAYNTKTETEGINATSTSATDFGINGGAGLVVRLGHLLSAYAEGRVDNVYTKSGFIDSDQIQVVPVNFGIVF
jgi:opacity protein-like surface antigen